MLISTIHYPKCLANIKCTVTAKDLRQIRCAISLSCQLIIQINLRSVLAKDYIYMRPFVSVYCNGLARSVHTTAIQISLHQKPCFIYKTAQIMLSTSSVQRCFVINICEERPSGPSCVRLHVKGERNLIITGQKASAILIRNFDRGRSVKAQAMSRASVKFLRLQRSGYRTYCIVAAAESAVFILILKVKVCNFNCFVNYSFRYITNCFPTKDTNTSGF